MFKKSPKLVPVCLVLALLLFAQVASAADVSLGQSGSITVDIHGELPLIEYKNNNGDTKKGTVVVNTTQIPHLLLRKDGALNTAQSERTLTISVSNVPLTATTPAVVEVLVVTQYPDPDSTTPVRIVVWNETKTDTLSPGEHPTTTAFAISLPFPAQVQNRIQHPATGNPAPGSGPANIDTPTGYFRIEISINGTYLSDYDSVTKPGGLATEYGYHFLMDEERTAALYSLGTAGEESPGAGPYFGYPVWAFWLGVQLLGW